METHELDNSVGPDLNKLVTWQYDNAPHICGIVDMLSEFFTKSVSEPWDIIFDPWPQGNPKWEWFLAKIGSVWGIPRYQVEKDGTVTQISTSLYWTIIYNYIQLVNSNSSLYSYWTAFRSVFGTYVTFVDNHDMTVTLSFNEGAATTEERKLLAKQYGTRIFPLPTGVRFTNDDDGSYRLFSVTPSASEAQDDRITNFSSDPDGSGSFYWE